MNDTYRAFEAAVRRLDAAQQQAAVTASVIADYAVRGCDIVDWLTTDWMIRRAALFEARADSREAGARHKAARAAA